MISSILYLISEYWYVSLILVIIFISLKSSKEGFYGWIPISTRTTRNMSYDLRGDPQTNDKKFHPYRTREWLGSFFYGLFPLWLVSPRHPLA